MSKEEYAQLYYLLGKLKYCFAESAIKSNHFMEAYEELSDNIDDILKLTIIIDGKEKD